MDAKYATLLTFSSYVFSVPPHPYICAIVSNRAYLSSDAPKGREWMVFDPGPSLLFVNVSSTMSLSSE